MFGQDEFELVRIVGTAVGEPPLQERPDAFVRVELRGVAGEVLEPQPGVTGFELVQDFAAVNRGGIEQHDERAAQVAQQGAEECGDVHEPDVVVVQPIVQAQSPPPRADRDHRDGRYPVASEPMPEVRRPAAGSPGPDDRRDQEETRLVEEDEMGPQPRCVFFTCGKRLRFQRRIASSSLSTARRSGFWWVQPSRLISRPMWSRW
jgi:hypothetical protein